MNSDSNAVNWLFLLPAISLWASCAVVPGRPSARNASDSWTGVYVPGPAEDIGKLQPEALAVVVERSANEYWILHGGYIFPARADGNALIATRLPRPERCPLGARECDPPIARLDRAAAGVRIGQTVLAQHESSSFLRAIGSGFNLVSVSDHGRLRYEHGILFWETNVDDPARNRCVAGMVLANIREPLTRSDGYSARAIILASDQDPDKAQTPSACAAMDPKRVHSTRTMPGLALVANASGQVVGAYALGYMHEELFAALPRPSDAELRKIARIGAAALGAHVGQSAE